MSGAVRRACGGVGKTVLAASVGYHAQQGKERGAGSQAWPTKGGRLPPLKYIPDHPPPPPSPPLRKHSLFTTTVC